jgi:pyruvate kinase
LGPASFNENGLKISHQDNYLYRINGAHNNRASVEKTVCLLREKYSNPKIIMDLPGNKIRTVNLGKPIQVKKGQEFTLNASNTNFPDFKKYLEKGQIVYADDSTLMFKVIECNRNQLLFTSFSDGFLKNGKGLHVRGIHSDIPFLFEKDLELINVANELKLEFVGLSFVRNYSDIDLAIKKINNDISILPKVETLSAVKNINTILENVDQILIDRGDLSTDVGLYKVPIFQDYIIKKAKYFNKPVYLATQFLKNMEINPIPTIAEVVDLYNTLTQDVRGIQLSEETAVGKYPQECLDTINQIITENSEGNNDYIQNLISPSKSE